MGKSGRPKSIDSSTEEEIRSELSGKDYWKSSQIISIVKKKSGVKYTQRHVRRLMQRWDYALTPRKKHKNAASDEEVTELKKTAEILSSLRKGMTAVCMDESVFVYDSIVRRVWTKKGSKPRTITTGSHKKIFVFGAVALDGSTLFRSYDSMTSREFIAYLNALRRKYGKYVLFYDGAPWHTSDKVKKFLKKHRRSIKPVRFPTCSPELNPAEECWNQGKEELLGSTIPHSFKEMKREVLEYYRTRRFELNIVNYICPWL